jgi:thiosulfate dehydrogenase
MKAEERRIMYVKWFVLGMIVILVAISAAAYVYLEQGFVSIRADAGPSPLDRWLGSAMDASAERHAPNVANPAPDNEATLAAAAKVYASRCGECHGTPAERESPLGRAFNPPAPQFFSDDPPDMKENENFYIIKHGVRMTAMPAWNDLLSDEQIWQTVTLLKHINNKSVPAAVEQELNTPQPAHPASPASAGR